MRDERERSGGLDALCGGERADGIAAAVHVDVLQPQREHFLGQTARELQLPGRGRAFGVSSSDAVDTAMYLRNLSLQVIIRIPPFSSCFFHISNISFL